MNDRISLALYQPDIPQNLGGTMRLSACTGVTLHVVEPCGFIFDDKKLRRAGMDYVELAAVQRHHSWHAFCDWHKPQNRRMVLLTTKGSTALPDFIFQPGDILLAGRESAGVPEEVADYADARLFIPMQAPARSLNVTVSIAMALAEALRQTRQFP
jgi:tRNA (cytidine/uridine-2'-O-)-methyltransferase